LIAGHLDEAGNEKEGEELEPIKNMESAGVVSGIPADREVNLSLSMRLLYVAATRARAKYC